MKHPFQILATCAALVISSAFASAAIVNVPRTITSNTTWTKDNTYLLQGYTFVINNSTLTIEPGTVIKGKVSTGAGAAALIITRGAKIMAVGTATAPIIFTSELDNLNGNLGASDTGLWGGLILLGKARINSRANSQPAGVTGGWNEDQIEGLSVTGTEVAYATFGGTDDTDSSGTLKYVSVRHGGAVIGGDNEINGISFGGVGSGTTVDYVEIFANKDDGMEFFGGTVNASHLVMAFGNDDGPDMDQGYRGHIQFVFSIQTDIGTDRGDKGIEWDGATAPLDATPKGDVAISNVTMIGIGNSGSANTAVNIRDNVTAHLYNSIFVNFAKGLDIEDDVGTPNPDIKHNIWWSHVAANNTAAGLNARPTGAVNASAYWSTASNDNAIADPLLRGISYTANRGLDPRPAAGSPALTGTVEVVSAYGLTQVNYKGAFSDSNWAAGWTKLWTDGYFSLDSAGTGGDVAIISGSANKFVNVSTLATVTSSSPITAGFIIPAGQAQTVLIRGVGQTLGVAPFNIAGVLADPTIEVYKAGASAPFATNDNWSGSQIMTVAAQVGAFPLVAASADAAIILNLEPGAYTVVVKSKGSASGLAIVEVYEVD